MSRVLVLLFSALMCGCGFLVDAGNVARSISNTSDPDPYGHYYERPCNSCNGAGWKYINGKASTRCHFCKGTGVMPF